MSPDSDSVKHTSAPPVHPIGEIDGRSRQLFINSLYLAQIIISIVVIAWPFQEDCASCIQNSVKPAIALLGLFSYSLVLGLRMSYFPRANQYFAPLAFGIHLILLIEMAAQRKICVMCLGSGLVALGLLLTEARSYRKRWLLATTGIIIAGLSAWLRPVLALEERILLSDSGHEGIVSKASYKDGKLNVLALVKRKCKYCDDFENNYVPRLKLKFSNQIEVRFIRLTEEAVNKGNIKTPVIIVGRSMDKSHVIEGLPSYDMIDHLLGRLLSN